MIAAARPLCDIDAAIERARQATATKLASPRFKRLVRGQERFHREYLTRRQRYERMRFLQSERNVRRQTLAETPLAVPIDRLESTQLTLEQGYLWAETRAATEVLHAKVRALMAARLYGLAAAGGTQEPSFYTLRADRLHRARRRGTWGFHRQTGAWCMFFDDRSGLTHLDPSEARREQARQVRRLKDTLRAFYGRGLHVYSAVFSEPNVPAGHLAWGKRHLFNRFRRTILGCTANGSRRRDGGAFPEIVGALTIQEDPLAKDGEHWNVHLNVILVVDPKRCTPLAPELVRQLEMPLPGAIAKFPTAPARDRTPPGLLSYAKLHYVWDHKHQLKLRKLEARNEAAIDRALLEAIKYRAKWISAKQLDEATASRPTDSFGKARAATDSRSDRPEPPDGAPRGEHPLGDRVDNGASQSSAPGILDWPNARLAEWIDASIRFRRTRGFGCLYRLGPDPLPENDERQVRYVGTIFVSPHGALVRVTHAQVNLIHGDKSVAIFPPSTGRSPSAQARAGPTTGGAAA